MSTAIAPSPGQPDDDKPGKAPVLNYGAIQTQDDDLTDRDRIRYRLDALERQGDLILASQRRLAATVERMVVAIKEMRNGEL